LREYLSFFPGECRKNSHNKGRGRGLQFYKKGLDPWKKGLGRLKASKQAGKKKKISFSVGARKSRGKNDEHPSERRGGVTGAISKGKTLRHRKKKSFRTALTRNLMIGFSRKPQGGKGKGETAV